MKEVNNDISFRGTSETLALAGDGNLFTIDELIQLEELHLIIGNKRIIVKPSNW